MDQEYDEHLLIAGDVRFWESRARHDPCPGRPIVKEWIYKFECAVRAHAEASIMRDWYDDYWNKNKQVLWNDRCRQLATLMRQIERSLLGEIENHKRRRL